VHPVLNALVDVQAECRRLVILYDTFFDSDGRIAMLLDSLERRLERPVPKSKLLFVVVDPVVVTGTKKRMLSFEM
jgi:hypothetical protein